MVDEEDSITSSVVVVGGSSGLTGGAVGLGVDSVGKTTTKMDNGNQQSLTMTDHPSPPSGKIE